MTESSSETPPEAGPSDAWSGIGFRLGELHLLCAMPSIDALITRPPVTPLPGSKPLLLGIANVRGSLVPIVDLGGYLFGAQTLVTPDTRLLLTRFQGYLTGLMVSEVLGPRHFHDPAPGSAPAWHLGGLAGLIAQGFSTPEALWGVLNLEALGQRADFMNGSREP